MAKNLTPEERRAAKEAKRAAKEARQNKINPVTGLTKRGMVGVTPQDQIRPQAQTDIQEALKQGGAFGNLIGKFQTVDPGQTGQMKDFLDRNRGLAEEAYKFSGREEKSLGEMEKGLEGYNSQEVQAMRESANAEMDRNLKTAQYQQAIQQARAGVSGGAALAGAQDLALQGLEGKRATERDLVIQNAQEALARKQAFANSVNAAEAARWGRTGAMQGQYGQFLTAEEAARRQAEQFNATQGTNEQLARAGLTLEGAGIYTGQIGSAEANRLAALGYNTQNVLANKQMKYANQQAEQSRQNQLAIAGINADAIKESAAIQANAMQQNRSAPMQGPGAGLPPIGNSATGQVSPQSTMQTQRVGNFNTQMQKPAIYGQPVDNGFINRSMGFKQTATTPTRREEEERRMY